MMGLQLNHVSKRGPSLALLVVLSLPWVAFAYSYSIYAELNKKP